MRYPDEFPGFIEDGFVVFIVPLDEAGIGEQVFGSGDFSGFDIETILVGKFADEHLEPVAEVVFHGVHGRRPGNVVVGSVGVLFGIFIAAQEQLHRFPEGGRAVRIQRIGHQTGKHHRAANGQWPARPPQVQGTDVAVPDGFIAHTFGGYFLDGQGYFD